MYVCVQIIPCSFVYFRWWQSFAVIVAPQMQSVIRAAIFLTHFNQMLPPLRADWMFSTRFVKALAYWAEGGQFIN